MPRRPKPTALKILQGNPGHRPLNGREPNVACKIPKPPAYLDERGMEEWRRVSRELLQGRIISSLDRANLGIYCAAVSRMEEAEVALRDFERIVANPEIDDKKRGQAVYMLNLTSGKRRTAAEEVRRIGVEFGLTPSSRGKIQVTDPQLTFDIIDGGGAETPFQRSARLAGT